MVPSLIPYFLLILVTILFEFVTYIFFSLSDYSTWITHALLMHIKWHDELKIIYNSYRLIF